MRATWWVSALAFLGLACGPSGASTSVAVGARSELGRTLGPCRPVSSATLRFDGDAFEALAPGVVHVACRDGTYTLHVRPAARLEIRPVARATVGDRLVYGASAFDASGGELELGADAPLSWSFSGALAWRPRPGCGDILPFCPGAGSGYATADRPGVGTITVALGTLRATSTTTVVP